MKILFCRKHVYMDFKKEDIKLLKVAVGEKYGRPIKTAGECNLLAQEITASVAGERISQNTNIVSLNPSHRNPADNK